MIRTKKLGISEHVMVADFDYISKFTDKKDGRAFLELEKYLIDVGFEDCVEVSISSSTFKAGPFTVPVGRTGKIVVCDPAHVIVERYKELAGDRTGCIHLTSVPLKAFYEVVIEVKRSNRCGQQSASNFQLCTNCGKVSSNAGC